MEYNISMNSKANELNLVFSTPLWAFIIDDHENLNTEMLGYITNLQKQDPKGVKRSNISGWHSNAFDLGP